ncbi:hypothetical protein RRG08_060456 [Elysia crispata]|uniref:Uncharacterized protein n=1 Tax=Elysia crispata TaxID=231223 RepID=A0AAE1B223_9GAST|nr:hypothetical protein RRG08_060456 [Elysia crispata]
MYGRAEDQGNLIEREKYEEAKRWKRRKRKKRMKNEQLRNIEGEEESNTKSALASEVYRVPPTPVFFAPSQPSPRRFIVYHPHQCSSLLVSPRLGALASEVYRVPPTPVFFAPSQPSPRRFIVYHPHQCSSLLVSPRLGGLSCTTHTSVLRS